MERITPTIGRIVLAHTEMVGREGTNMVRVVYPAIVTAVYDADGPDPRVDVTVFASPDLHSGREGCCLALVPILEPGEGSVQEHVEWCEWMPHQKGQAALTEAIAKKAGINA